MQEGKNCNRAIVRKSNELTNWDGRKREKYQQKLRRNNSNNNNNNNSNNILMEETELKGWIPSCFREIQDRILTETTIVTISLVAFFTFSKETHKSVSYKKRSILPNQFPTPSSPVALPFDLQILPFLETPISISINENGVNNKKQLNKDIRHRYLYCRVSVGIALIHISNRISAVKYTCSSTDTCSEIHFTFDNLTHLYSCLMECCAMPREIQPQMVRAS
jgi:hypothetical protein